MFVFNFGVGSLEHSVTLGRFVIFDFLGNSLQFCCNIEGSYLIGCL